MIRFIKKILDIKNILGMQRTPIPTPLPAYPANQFVMRSDVLINDVTPTFTGSQMWLTVTEYGNTHTYYFPQVASGNVLQVATDIGTDAIFEQGNITDMDLSAADVNFVAVNDTVQNITINNNLRTLDLRNAAVLTSVAAYPSFPYGVRELYARATDIIRREISKSFINNSPDGGVLWIDRTQTYAADVIAAAEAHNWTIYDL